MKREKDIVYCVGVTSPGGETIVLDVLQSPRLASSLFIVDEVFYRAHRHLFVGKNYISCPAGARGRLKAEIAVLTFGLSYDSILSFNSLPPLIFYNLKLTIFFHNVNLLKLTPHKKISFRNVLKFFYFRLALFRVSKIIVQTDAVKENIRNILNKNTKIPITVVRYYPWLGIPKKLPNKKSLSQKRNVKFLYVADGAFHKNHLMLMQAWELLSRDFDVKYKLSLTLGDKDAELWELISDFSLKHELKIYNLGEVPRHEMPSVYKKHDVLIYPSLSESLGLPLLEAQEFGLDIICSELDYAREVCEPSETFDARSFFSVKDAVLRYTGVSSSHRSVWNDREGLLAAYFDEEKI